MSGTGFGADRTKRWRYAAALVVASPTGVADAQTAAGTPIVNTAAATYAIDGVAREARSNTVTLVVAERLDVGLVRADDAVTQIADAPVAIPATLTNMGSGEEAFALHAESSTASATVRGIAIDRDGDGRFEPATDTMIAGTTPSLAPGETLRLVAIVAPAGAARADDGTLTLTAEATTGSGRVDELFAGRGDGGADAVIGPTGARAAVVAAFAAVPPQPTLAKTQAVRAPDGSADPVSGAVVTYTLTARFPATPTRAARVDDPLPAGTIYLPGTLTLDGLALSDAEDGDAGSVADRRVVVALGDVAPEATRTVRFQIRLP